MPSYKVPGTYYEETVNQAAVVTGANLSAAAFLGPNPRGPITPARITSWAQYLQLFGGFVAGYALPHAVYQYFVNGGREAYCCRVASATAAAATKTFVDRTPAQSGVQTLTITGVPTGGTYTITYSGQTTAGQAITAVAATIQTAVQGLSSVGAGNALVTGGPLAAVFTDGVTTLASPTLTSATASFVSGDIGKTISGTNIPVGTTIIAVNSATSVTMSANGTASGVSLTFTVWRSFTVTFAGTLANVAVATITTSPASLTGGTTPAVVVAVTQTGTAGGLSTLQVNALNPGAWANLMYVDIVASGTDRFHLIVRLGGTGDQYIVERWTDLSMTDTDARYAVNVVNSVSAGSTYIKVIDLVSASAAPNDLPAVTGTPQALASGSDGTAVGESDITTAIPNFDVIDAPLNINIPGDGVAATHTVLLNYCAARGDCFAVLDPPSGQSAVAAASFGTAESGTQLSFGALYYPWIYVPDPAGGTGATRLIPPGGAMLGQFAATDVARGVWKTPAGLTNRIAGAVGIETKLTQTDLGNLNLASVNVIRQIPGAGIVPMGGRTLKPNGSDKYISVRRSLIYIRSSLLTGTRFAVFEPNDATLWGMLQSVINRFLLNFWQDGGLRGGTPGEAFYVKCDDQNNTGGTIAAGEVHVEIGVALQLPAEFIVIKLTQREVGAAVTVAA